MKIAFYEMEHFETAAPLLTLFLRNQYEVLVCSNQSCRQQIEEQIPVPHNALQWLLMEEGETNYAFIQRFSKTIAAWKPALIWYNTLSNNFLLHAWVARRQRQATKVLVVHAVNSLFDEPATSIRSLVRRRGMQLLRRHIDAFAVFTDDMRQRLVIRLAGARQSVHLVPGALYEGASAPPAGRPLTIALVGTIDAGRRRYDQVIPLAEALEKKAVRCTISVAGKAAGEEVEPVLEKIRAWKGQYASLQLHEKWLTHQEYRELLHNSHMIWCPAVETSLAYYNIAEQYGLTKATGNYFDAIRAARPFAGPSYLPAESLLSDSSFSYTGINELAGFVESLAADENLLQHWLQKAAVNSNRFTLAQTAQRFYHDWQSLLGGKTGMQKYFLQNDLPAQYLHGGIGYHDQEKILLRNGYAPLALAEGRFPVIHLKRWLQANRLVQQLQPGDLLVAKFPVYPRLHRFLLSAAARKNVRVVMVLMDIDGLKSGNTSYLQQELAFLKCFRHFVVHNKNMEDWLRPQLSSQAVYTRLGPFDYLAPANLTPRKKMPIVNYSGNLEKSRFIYSLGKITGVSFLLYGKGGEAAANGSNVNWKGVYAPHLLPAVAEGSFGLVWDGDSIDGAGGVYGSYMPYIFHHKLSLYLLAGLPIFVYAKAGSAAYILEKELGWKIDRLTDLPGRIESIPAEEYERIAANVRREALVLAGGRQLLQALQSFSF